MPGKVDLYDSSYANYTADVYRQVRLETYGHDLGQTSWVTKEESAEIPRLLELTTKSSVLEIGCGSGGYAVHVAKTIGCHIVGLDTNAAGIRNANELAAAQHLTSQARFEQFDASQRLPFEEATFEAVFANDVLCHLPGRPTVLCEIFRVLKPAGKLLFSDALVIGGMISHEEIAVRSSIGYYVYSPPGENERLLREAGFADVQTIDTTANASLIAKRWRQAREKRKPELVVAEGAENFEGLQRFLACVDRLTAERHLLRNLYIAQKPE